jgi:hypothetical protein
MNKAMNEFYLENITLHREIYEYTVGESCHGYDSGWEGAFTVARVPS